MNRPPRAIVTRALCEHAIRPRNPRRHHLVRKNNGGRRTKFLHRARHRQVLAPLTEAGLAGQ